MSKTEKINNYCRDCHRDTNQSIVEEYVVSPFDDYAYNVKYQIVECCGCSYVSFRKVEIDYENGFYIDDLYSPDVSVSQYPICLKNHIGLNDFDIFELPKTVLAIYQDTLKSYANGSKILTGAGLRACIEAVCNDLDIKGKDLEARINKLNKEGFISKSNTNLLHGIRFIGNNSIHEIKEPTEQELDVGLRIVEHLFENVYILPKVAQGSLKSIIDEYDEFLKILSKNLKNFNNHEEFGLFKLLGEDFKYCKDNLSNFEKRLIDDIQSDKFKELSMGKIKKHEQRNIQCFIVQSTH